MGFGGLSTETGEGQGRGKLVFGNLYNLRGTESHGWQGDIAITIVPSYMECCTIVQELTCHPIERLEVIPMGNAVFLPKRKRLHREQANTLRQLVLDFGLDETVQAEIDNAIYKLTDETDRWVFMRVSQEAFRHVIKAIHATRNVATTLSVWNAALTYMRWDTGEIVSSREQLADDACTNSVEVSRAMSTLIKIGAVVRRRRGQRVVYFVNGSIAWHGSEGSRQAAVKEAPVLRLVVNRDEERERS